MKKLIAILVIASLFGCKKEEKKCLTCTDVKTVRHNGVIKSQVSGTGKYCFTEEELEKFLNDKTSNEVSEYSPGVIQTIVKTVTCKE
jgi:hypothetical protein